jgi:heme oxygenase
LSSNSSIDNVTTVISLLRKRTRPLHNEIESGIDLSLALSSRGRYRSLLEGYLGLYRPFERALAKASEAVRSLADWPAHAHVPLLERDILALGATPADLQTIPDAPGLPELNDSSAMLGALYVIEGSQLGGQIIFRDVQAKLQLDAASGAAFFAGSGDHTGAHWKRFLAGLEEQVQQPESAADAAVAMFHYFGNWLGSVSRLQEKA